MIGKMKKVEEVSNENGTISDIFKCERCDFKTRFSNEGEECEMCLLRKKHHEDEFEVGIL